MFTTASDCLSVTTMITPLSGLSCLLFLRMVLSLPAIMIFLPLVSSTLNLVSLLRWLILPLFHVEQRRLRFVLPLRSPLRRAPKMSKRFFCNAGSKVKKVYEPTFTSSGARVLVCVGEEDLHGYIQSFKDQVDLQCIIKRFKLTGDPSGFNAQAGLYGDFTHCPETLAEFLNLQNRAKLLFDQLPADVRSTFNNDVNQFFVSYGSDAWLEKVKPFLPAIETSPEEVSK